MAAAKIKSNSRSGNLLRSRSEGTLIDIDENVTINNNNLHGNYEVLSISISLSLHYFIQPLYFH